MTLTRGLLTGAGALLTFWVGWGAYSIYSTERPPYEVLQQLGSDVEIRQYDEQTWISTTYNSDRGAFPVLASYIFGQNAENQDIAMTAPVVTDERMSFILPAGMDADDAPAPEGQAIEFTTVPPRTVATLSFSWWTSQERVEQKTQELLTALREAGIETTGAPYLMRYNDPWTPPFMRRNEVAIEVQ